MPHTQLSVAVQEAAQLQVSTLKRHDVWRFDDGLYEVVRFDGGDVLGEVSVIESAAKLAVDMTDPITFNLPFVKQKPTYIGVTHPEISAYGNTLWLAKANLTDLIVHLTAVEFTCEKSYAISKGLPVHLGVPVFKPKPHAPSAPKPKTGGFGPLGPNNVESAFVGIDYAGLEQKVMANVVATSGVDDKKLHDKYGIVWDDKVKKFAKGPKIEQSKSPKEYVITLPLAENSPAYLGLTVDGKTIYWKKSSLSKFSVGEITATIQVSHQLLKSKKLLSLVDGEIE